MTHHGKTRFTEKVLLYLRAAMAHGNTETLWTAPWIGVDVKVGGVVC